MIQKDGRIRRWAPIAEMDGRYLRVILLPDRETVHNAFFDRSFMKIQYFQDSDSLYFELRAADVAETKDLNEDTLLDIDQYGNICGITIEHASQRTDVPRFSYEQIAA